LAATGGGVRKKAKAASGVELLALSGLSVLGISSQAVPVEPPAHHQGAGGSGHATPELAPLQPISLDHVAKL
jgi:hypothetical protein